MSILSAIMDELVSARNEARENWSSEEAKELLKKIVHAIQNKLPWDELLAQRPGYFYDVRNLSGTDLIDIDLSGLNLRDISFAYTNCSRSKFIKSFLAECSFTFSELVETNFDRAFLENVRFGFSDLSNASFNGAFLKGANLGNCNLTNVDFRNADLTNTMFYGANMKNVKLSGQDMSTAKFGTYVNDELQLHGWHEDLLKGTD